MTTADAVSGGEPVQVEEPLFSPDERAALAGFLAGYSGLTREAYTLDLRLYTGWCAQHGLHLSPPGAPTSSASAMARDGSREGWRGLRGRRVANSNRHAAWRAGFSAVEPRSASQVGGRAASGLIHRAARGGMKVGSVVACPTAMSWNCWPSAASRRPCHGLRWVQT
jgi:hypothetical protein